MKRILLAALSVMMLSLTPFATSAATVPDRVVFLGEVQEWCSSSPVKNDVPCFDDTLFLVYPLEDGYTRFQAHTTAKLGLHYAIPANVEGEVLTIVGDSRTYRRMSVFDYQRLSSDDQGLVKEMIVRWKP